MPEGESILNKIVLLVCKIIYFLCNITLPDFTKSENKISMGSFPGTIAV